MYEKIPSVMKSYPNWLVWKLESRETGKPTKIPYSVKGGLAKVNDPTTWGTFDEAVNLYQQGGYSGIGFVFKNTPFVGVDIDGCLDSLSGKLTPEAQDIVKVLHSYTEVSQSGTGLHIIMKGHLPDGRRRNGSFEMYGERSSRYFAMTGSLWGNTQEIREDQIAIDFIHQTYIERPDSHEKKVSIPSAKPSPTVTPAFSEHEILSKARSAQNGDKFWRLWNGDTSDYENDESRADLALCSMLAFWCNRDFNVINHLFRQSKLMRPKWDEKRGEKTYGEITVQHAVDSCKEVYSVKEIHSLPQSVREWECPEPFNAIPLPDFPVECLPKPLADFVTALAETTQTPLEMGGVLSLAVLSTAFQSRYTVEITPDWTQPLCLYTLAIAPSGERKSPVMSNLVSPILDYQDTKREQERKEVARNQAEKAMLEIRYRKAKSLYEQALEKNGDLSKCRQNMISAKQELDAFKEIYPFQLLTDDTTQEKLVDLLEKHNGAITIQSAEGGVFTTMAGKYKSRLDIDVYLKGYSKEAITVERIGRPSNYIRHPCISMMLSAQPIILENVMNNKEFEGRGLCARFIYAMCKSKVGYRDVNPPSIPPLVKEDYKLFVNKILSSSESGTLYVSNEARETFDNYRKEIEYNLRSKWESFKDWGSKADGTTVRIAALFHAAEIEKASQTPISADSMERAIKVMKCLSYHALAAYQMMSIDKTEKDAQYLWKRIHALQKDNFSKSELFDKCKGRFKTAKDMEAALNLLEERHYIGISQSKTGQKGRPSQHIEVNPLAKNSNNSKNG